MIKTCKSIQEKIKINFLYLILAFVILNFTNCEKKVTTTTTTDLRDKYVGSWTLTYSSNFPGTGDLSYDSFKSDIIKYVGTDSFLRVFPYNNMIYIPQATDYTFAKLENYINALLITSSVEKDTLYLDPDGSVYITNAAQIDFVNYLASYDSTVNKYTTKNYDLVFEQKSINYSIKFNSNSNLVFTNNRTYRLKSTIKNFNKTFPLNIIGNYTKK